jgi:hypothetical protein
MPAAGLDRKPSRSIPAHAQGDRVVFAITNLAVSGAWVQAGFPGKFLPPAA